MSKSEIQEGATFLAQFKKGGAWHVRYISDAFKDNSCYIGIPGRKSRSTVFELRDPDDLDLFLNGQKVSALINRREAMVRDYRPPTEN